MPHALDHRIRTAHAVAGIRRSLYLAPDSPKPAALQAGLHAAPTAAAMLLASPAAHPRRVGAIMPADSQHRIHLRKLLKELGWGQDARLVARLQGMAATVTAGGVANPADLRISVDPQGRLCLPPTVAAALRLDGAGQVLAAAEPDSGRLHLRSANEALGALFGGAEPLPPPTVAPPPAGRSRVRRRFTPDPTAQEETR